MKVRCIESVHLNGPNGYLLKYTMMKPFLPYRKGYSYVFSNKSFCMNKNYSKLNKD